MPSRSEGWGGLFKDEQYRLISVSPSAVRFNLDSFVLKRVGAEREPNRKRNRWLLSVLFVFEQTAPPLLRKGTPPDSSGEWAELSWTAAVPTVSGQSFSVQCEQTGPRLLGQRLVVDSRIRRTPTVHSAVHFDFRLQVRLGERFF